ncbi:hypothetical protein TL16_g06495 [Triparma laevis f. inornata]|uniref:Uncharacterized protein n=1 Tax=Triparma laevis f. inornata TaxID=1714386 RepID=A0A9W7ED70_9STRA|nr:hypothetical protein TL16_g06495 [Triparma laevis f. inornata]
MGLKKHKACRLLSAILRAVLSCWAIVDIWLANVQPWLDMKKDWDAYIPDTPSDIQLVIECLVNNTYVLPRYDDYSTLYDPPLSEDDFAGRYLAVSKNEELIMVGTLVLLFEIVISIVTAFKTNEDGEAPPKLVALDAVIDIFGFCLASIIASKTWHAYEVIDSFAACFPSKDSVLWSTANIPERGDVGGAHAMAVVIAITQAGEFVDKLTEYYDGMVTKDTFQKNAVVSSGLSRQRL